ncbi:GTP cyclohydrolase I FolE [Venenivibrio stagnispumantis]|uniref:GTP cyclohydrolase 1 n=1 Tax=Venenivibrio stagnispumantis TaxID=407998 RepID=A0AA45WP12_9AQUI|nr:GTP cyclohydrolase I FolE [Venenivibrio stagnispumantis]MCW4573873.1 GTP cyclohydrolase I FolE [Venenivibrio stagnispumantis]SMP19593.1 GTP cyclohydrolase I [Venenivibrio stagnispumantis]
MAIDKNKIEQAIKLFIEGIGEDPNREGLRDTPKRVAKMWEEFESYREMNMTIFEEVGSYDEMVVVRDIQFFSLCEHHLLPFFGKAHIAYIPNGKVCGLSKLVRVVNKFSYRPQVQERLTAEIAEYLEKELNPKGVAVVMEGVHLCMSMRGVRNPESVTVTSKLTGVFKEDEKTRNEFLNLINSHKKI